MGSRGAATLVLLILSCVVSGVVCSVEDGLPRPENFPNEPTTTYGPTPQLTGSNGLPSDCQWYGWANSVYDAATGTTCLEILRKALTNATVNPPSSLEPYKYYTIQRLINPTTNQSYCYEGCFILTAAPAQSPLGDSVPPPFASPPEPLTGVPSPLGDSLAPTPLGDASPPAPGDPLAPTPLGDPLAPTPLGDPLAPTPLGDPLAPTPLGDPLAPIPLGDPLAPAPLGDLLAPAPLGDSLAPTPGVDSPAGAPPPVLLTPAGSPPVNVPVPAPSDTYPVNEPLPSPPALPPTLAAPAVPPPPTRSLSPPAPPVTVIFNGGTSVAPSVIVSCLLVCVALFL